MFHEACVVVASRGGVFTFSIITADMMKNTRVTA